MTKQDRLKQLHDRALKIRSLTNGDNILKTIKILNHCKAQYLKLYNPDVYNIHVMKYSSDSQFELTPDEIFEIKEE